MGLNTTVRGFGDGLLHRLTEQGGGGSARDPSSAQLAPHRGAGVQ